MMWDINQRERIDNRKNREEIIGDELKVKEQAGVYGSIKSLLKTTQAEKDLPYI